MSLALILFCISLLLDGKFSFLPCRRTIFGAAGPVFSSLCPSLELLLPLLAKLQDSWAVLLDSSLASPLLLLLPLELHFLIPLHPKKAASEDRWADSAVGNITGSNAVNVFLGLGLPWVIAVSYYQKADPPTNYHVPTKGLDVTVASFLCCSFVAISILLIRRCLFKGELGGTGFPRIFSAICLASLWVIYIVINILA